MCEIKKEEGKFCRNCKINKPLTEYHKSNKSIDGYQWQCIQCHRNRFCKKKYGVELNELTSLECNTCKIIKPIIDFNKSSKRVSGRQLNCKSCESQYYVSSISWKPEKEEITLDSIRSCKGCAKEQIVSEFPKQKGNHLDKSYFCAQCTYKFKKKYAKNKRGHKCMRCEIVKPITEYPMAIRVGRVCNSCIEKFDIKLKQNEKRKFNTKYTVKDEYGNEYKDYIKKVSFISAGEAATKRWQVVKMKDDGKMMQCENCWEYRITTFLCDMVDATKCCSTCIKNNGWQDLVVKRGKMLK